MEASEKSAPVPVSETDCGELPALLAMFKIAERVPAADGANETTMPQLDPAASDALHWFCNEKSTAFGPDTVTPLTVSGALPALVSVTDWLPALPTTCVVKLTFEGASAATGTVPVPVSATV